MVPGGVQVCEQQALPNELIEAVASPNEPVMLRQVCVFSPPGSSSSVCTRPGRSLSIPEHLLGPLQARVGAQERISFARPPVWGASWRFGE